MNPATPRRAGTPRRPPPPDPGGARVVLLNKPCGVLCQFSADGSGKPTLADFVRVPGVYPAGRLDADSEGLVVLTADGALQARIAHPRHKLAKVYLVQVEGLPTPAQVAALEAGVDLGDFVTAPARRAGDRRAAGTVAAPAADPRAPGDSDRLARAGAARRAPPAGAADDRRGRPADAAADPLGGRAVDPRGAAAGRRAHRIGAGAHGMIGARRSSGRDGSPRGSPALPARPALSTAPPTGSASLVFTSTPAAAFALPPR